MNKLNIFTIAKYAFKEELFPFMPKKIVPNMPKSYLGRLVLLLWTYVFFGFIFTGIFKGSAMLYVGNDMEYMYFVTFAMSITLMIFVFYLPQILSRLYTKGAIENYQTMPVSEGELFLGKLFGGVFGFFDFFLYFCIGLFIYFVEAGFDPWVLVMGIILYFPMIFLPYGILSLVLLLLKKFTNVNRHEKLVKTIGYLLMFAMMAAIYYFSFSASNPDNIEGINVDVSQVTDILGTVSNVFFNAKFFGLALAGTMKERMIFTGLILVLAFVIGFISYKLANKFYYEAVFDEHLDTSKKEVKATKDVKIEAGSQFKAIFKKDLKTLFSNIIFLASPISMALILIVMGFGQGKVIMKEVGIDFSSPEFLLTVFLISLALGLFIWINGGIANTSLSREGRSFYHFQTMPIDPKTHMRARFLSSYLVVLIVNIVIAIAYMVIFKLNILAGLVIFVGLSISAAFATMLSLYFGTFMINTTWKKPQEIQQGGGLKAVGLYLGSMLIMAILGVIVFAITEYTDNIFLGAGVAFALVLVITILIIRACIKKYTKGFMDV